MGKGWGWGGDEMGRGGERVVVGWGVVSDVVIWSSGRGTMECG